MSQYVTMTCRIRDKDHFCQFIEVFLILSTFSGGKVKRNILHKPHPISAQVPRSHLSLTSAPRHPAKASASHTMCVLVAQSCPTL